MWTHRRSGLTHQRGIQDHRTPYEHDRTRVIHAPAFRRLQRKTQILGTDQGDFHRTRLTHSLEVASIGVSIVRCLLSKNPQETFVSLLPQEDLIHTICLLHDIGHPPFGHSGEVALNAMMREFGGFEGNAQTLRLLTKMENTYGPFGLDLTRRTLLGILKYPVKWSDALATQGLVTSSQPKVGVNAGTPPKAYFDCEQAEVEWILDPLCSSDQQRFQSFNPPPSEQHHGKAAYHSFDCSIMDIADDIAYGVHDLEDAIHLRFIQRDHLDTTELKALYQETTLEHGYERFIDHLFHREIHVRKQAIGELVNYFIASTYGRIQYEGFENPLLKQCIDLHQEARVLLNYFIDCIFRHVIDSHESRTYQFGGQAVVCRLFEAFSSNPESLLNQQYRALYHDVTNQREGMRVICDYIANMTDDQAHRTHEQLFGFNKRSLYV